MNEKKEKGLKWNYFFRKCMAGILAAALIAGSVCVSGGSVRAAEPEGHQIFLASDYQGDPKRENLQAITQAIGDAGISPELAVWCGDYIEALGWSDITGEETAQLTRDSVAYLRNFMSAKWAGIQCLFLQGNHDSTAVVKDGTMDATGPKEYEDYIVYVINHDDFPWRQGIEKSYAPVAQNRSRVEKMAADLDAYLRGLIDAGCRKPVIITTHVPLHWSARSTDWTADWLDNIYAQKVFDVVNEAAEQLDILYLFGHNHSSEFDQYLGGTVNYLGRGEVIRIPDGTQGRTNYRNQVLNFTYLNAGYIGYANQCLNPNVSTATILTVNEDSIEVEKYTKDGIYEPASHEIALHQKEEPNAAVVPAPREEEERRVGDSEQFEVAKGNTDPVSYHWSVSGTDVARLTSVPDGSAVTVQYVGKGEAALSCEVTYQDEGGEMRKLADTYDLTVRPELPDPLHLEEAAEASVSSSASGADGSVLNDGIAEGDACWSPQISQTGNVWAAYRWDDPVYIDTAQLVSCVDPERQIELADSFHYEYLTDDGQWETVAGMGETKPKQDQETHFDGFYTKGFRIVLKKAAGKNLGILEWKVNGDLSSAELLADFDFDDEENGLRGGLAVASGEHELQDGALYLDGSSTNWLNVTRGDYEPLLTGQKELTVSMDVKWDPEEANWPFYAAPHSYPQKIESEHYLGILLDGGVKAECYDSMDQARPSQPTVNAVNNVWMHLDVVYSEDATDLYINGRLGSHKHTDVAKDELLGEHSVVWIGKANWGEGEFFKGWIDNYQIAARALSAEEIAARQNTGALEATFDFDDEQGFESDGVTAAGTYALEPHDGGNAIRLNSSGQYLKVTAAETGHSVLTGYPELTVSFQAKPDVPETANWAFFAAANNSAQTYLQEKYLGVYFNDEGEVRAERYLNTGERAPRIAGPAADGWHYYTVVFDENQFILYVDGLEAGRQASDYALSDILGNNSVMYIGRATWGSGEFYKGLLDNYTIAGRAWSAAEVRDAAMEYVPELEADKTELEAAVADAVPEAEKDRYTEESWRAYEEALQAARKLLGQTGARQTEVEGAAQTLRVAQAALKEKPAASKSVTEIFDDVKDDDWFVDAVQYVYDQNIMQGLSATQFGPAVILSRAQFAVILYRMEGSPAAEYRSDFPDVPDDDKLFYRDAVMWASSENVGVITGYTGGSRKGMFGPADLITREQMAAMMYRFADYKRYNTKVSSETTGLPDEGSVSSFARKEMLWAVENGLVTGDKGLLNPQGTASRAVCATIIQRFLENIAK